MKLSLLFIFSLYTLFVSLPVFATSTSCTDRQKQVNLSNNMPVMLEFYYGPIKSMIKTSTLPEKGRFKAYKGEIQFDECGSLTKFYSSTQEYIHERIETNLVRMSTPYNIKYKYQLRSLHKIYTLYLNELYDKNNQNQIINKTAHFYDGDGSPIGTDFSKIFYDGNKIASETIIESSAENQGSTIYYSYDNEGRLLKAIDNDKVMLEFNYGEDGKILHQMQIFTSMYDDIREYDSTCQEWDKYNNCLTWNMVSEVRKDGIIIDTSTAIVYNKFEYY